MSYYGGLRIQTENAGARRADGFLESTADVVSHAMAIDGWGDQELEESFLHVVRVGASLGLIVAMASIGEERRLSGKLRAAQRGVAVVSAEIVREISLRDDEQGRQPPRLDELLAQAQELYPTLFSDPEYMYQSGLDLDSASPVAVEAMFGEPLEEVLEHAAAEQLRPV